MDKHDGEIHDIDNGPRATGAECPTCGDYGDCRDCGTLESDPDERDDQIEASMPCMGAAEGCVNPHPMHTYHECETVEMHETMRYE